MAEIPSTLPQASIFVHANPAFARVIGAIEPAIFGLDQRIDAARIPARNRNPDAAHNVRRQTVTFEALPCAAAVGGFVESAARSAAAQTPGCANHLPQRGKERVGVVGIKHTVNGAGFVVLEQDLLPRGAAIGSAEDPALVIRPVGVAQGRDKNNVRVLGINYNRANGQRIFYSDVLPTLAAIQRVVDAIARIDLPAN